MTAHLVIAGTKKAGTSSVYQYLAAHPGVGASTREESAIPDFIPVRSASSNLTFLLRKGVTEAPSNNLQIDREGCVIYLEHQQKATVCHASAIDLHHLALFVPAG